MMNENNRLHYWAALTVFSIVSLASMTNSFDKDVDWVQEQQWAVSVASISLIVGACSFFMRMFMLDMFTSSYMEHGASLVALVMWCAGLPNINDHLGPFMTGTMNERFSHVNPTTANLFFSSWMAFIMAMMLAADMFPAMFLKDNMSKFTMHWLGFGTASLIVMTNAITIWKDECDTTDDSPTCKRDMFALVLGAVSGFFALIFFVMNHEALEQTLSIVFCAAWCFGIAYLTFDQGPATMVGTYYFAVWFTFMFTFWMAVHSIVDVWTGMSGEDAPAAEEVKGATQEETAKQDAEEQEKEEVTA